MRRSKRLGGCDHYEVRRQNLIVLVEEALQGKAAKGTAVTRLNEDLLDSSFRTGIKDDPNQSTKEIKQVKKDSKKAERNYEVTRARGNQRSFLSSTDAMSVVNLLVF